ncbi:MAG TPA: BMC domain-containing protein [Candidatus Avimonoglobus intestinipullorum]|uniref:BMC domain-containing protein n=1 Tax=Candidatus Avimonoglobus intestinipullorum TaxID=2840699 RepID=A0A9D1LW27_9FIRM|nr:BMC domain-containing protein [Candidatus Avimonoglobus intestinipullorum]
MDSVGLIEVKNVSKGIKVTDEMLKSAGVTLLQSGSVCPGKFVTLVGGALSAIQAAVDRAALVAEDALIDKFVIGRLGEKVFEALAGIAQTTERKAFGIVETFTAASAILAADAAVKAAMVELIEVRIARGMGGKSFACFTGEVADVTAAVEAGARIAAKDGVLINTEVIANPHPDLWEAIL